MRKTEILVSEAIESYKTELDAYPKCHSDLRAEADFAGTPYGYADIVLMSLSIVER